MKKLSLVLVVLVCAPVWAAEFSPTLDAQIQNSKPTDLVSAIVILPSAVDIRALDLKLHEERANLARRHTEIIAALKYNAEITQPRFRAELDAAQEAGAVIGYTAYWIENLFVIQATREFVESLRARGDIAAVTENFRADPVESLPANEHGAPQPLDDLTLNNGVLASGAYRVNTELGITGAGTIVGNLDTGVNGNHPALAPRWRGLVAPWQECWRDAISGTSFPSDGMNHGTPTMGAMAGWEVNGEDTIWTGCAPNALWIADNAINQGLGPEFENDIVDAFQWFADPDGDPGTLDDVPDVIENNWGVSIYFGYPQCYDFWNTVILNCEAAGPVVTWSAGAEGPSGIMRSPAIFSLNAEQIFTVGSVDATGYPNAPYPLTSFSTHGPTPCVPAIPDNIKPEIVSPAVSIYTCTSGGGYQFFSGASFAEAHIAGIVALMREACPDCDYITIKDALMSTAIDEGAPGEDNLYGHGFVDAYAAVLAVMPETECTIECPPSSVLENEPVCHDNYEDEDNGGCGSDPVVWDTLECGQTVCATTGTFLYEGLEYRDTDWYQLELAEPATVTWTVHGNFLILAFILGAGSPDPCTGFTPLEFAIGQCSTEVNIEALDPGLYFLWVAPHVFTGVPCGTEYWGQVTCTPPLSAIDDLTAHASGSDVVLRWSAVPNATFYRIYTSPTSEEPWTLLDSTTATIYTHINGAGGERLFYDVRACSP